jgi:hypothetical protein
MRRLWTTRLTSKTKMTSVQPNIPATSARNRVIRTTGPSARSSSTCPGKLCSLTKPTSSRLKSYSPTLWHDLENGEGKKQSDLLWWRILDRQTRLCLRSAKASGDSALSSPETACLAWIFCHLSLLHCDSVFFCSAYTWVLLARLIADGNVTCYPWKWCSIAAS